MAAPEVAKDYSQQIVETEHLLKALLEQPNGGLCVCVANLRHAKGCSFASCNSEGTVGGGQGWREPYVHTQISCVPWDTVFLAGKY